MALSPNYQWAEPDNSSLVKNGAQDIRALGDAIDTSVWNVGYGQAAKNKYINADFNINQRQFTSVVNPVGLHNFDRWKADAVDGTSTYSAQTFTPGAAPVAGYESTNFLRIVTSGQTLTSALTNFAQIIEDVRTLAGNPVTVSFWAKANTGTPKIAVEFRQNFGSGGSAVVSTPVGAVTIGTTWQRYSLTGTVPSVSGKTIGANSFFNNTFIVSAGSDFNTRASSIGIQSNTFDVWGFQIEYGSKATPFQLAGGGAQQSELALCQRYYFRTKVSAAYGYIGNIGNATATSTARTTLSLPVPMRVQPNAIDYGGAITVSDGATLTTPGSITLETNGTTQAPQIVGNMSTNILTQFRSYMFQDNNAGTAYLGLNAEI
jgi:hypothetical protein